MAKLVILTGRHRGKKLNLPSKNKTLIVGRDEKCALRMASTDVSREHCSIRIEDGTIYVKDLGSSNGTQINDVTIESETELKPGQFLKVGPMLMQLEGEPGTARDPVSGEPVEGDSFSNDEIATALTEDTAESASTDTTILKRVDADTDPATPVALAPTASVSVKPVASVPLASKLKFDSVAEEGADIIRRHLAWKAQLTPAEPVSLDRK